MGVKGAVLRWLESYLTDRHQSVYINDAISEKANVRTGVPQGSAVGHLLFLVYMLPLRFASKGVVSPHGYADDSQLYTRLCLKYIQRKCRVQFTRRSSVWWI